MSRGDGGGAARTPVAVLGAGSWGTALAIHLGRGGVPVRLWARDRARADATRAARENARYLPGLVLPEAVTVTADAGAALAGVGTVLIAVPSHFVETVLTRVADHVAPRAVLVSATKGLEPRRGLRISLLLAERLPGRVVAVLSGPSFAREVAQGRPAALVVACADEAVAADLQRGLAGPALRLYTNRDMLGVELGGALKNVMAIAAGVADGLGLGYNSRAALITRGLAEISRLAVRKAANPLTLAGLAGLGDLVLTCTGDLSRNRHVGIGLGRGQTLREVLAGMSQIAEGVKTTKSAHDLAQRLGVEMPITGAIYRILYEDQPAREAVSALMGRAPKHELA